jgi:protein-ribulosamine 3-kinase
MTQNKRHSQPQPLAAADIDLSALPDGTHRRVLRDGRRVFAKVRRGMPADFFACEARGLAELRNTHACRLPEVLGVAAFGIVLEDLGNGQAAARDWAHAGQQLAAVHRYAGEQFGFRADGFCGDSPQGNTPDDDGFRFFAEHRLLPQMRRAFDAGLLGSEERARIESLCARLRERLPPRPPVLIHGDLWLGNLHACANGELALIDGGAVHYGWADADLAMLILFGEPPRSFFSAYESASGTGSDWRVHAPLLNLYHLLNHLNLFGGSYGNAVRQVLVQYS